HKMTEEYESIAQRIVGVNNTELVDFHSTRLVEMAGNIIMGYLLVLNSQKDEKFIKSAKLYVNLVRSENRERFDYMDKFEVENLDLYRAVETL
ncbi:MAG: acyl-CoA dehydrogenase, partial [Bacteroidetes bacterium]|nr:acyl-CoA dehydrogenase [Bacteroidota bacterium]